MPNDRRFQGKSFRLAVAPVNPGVRLYFIAGKSIAVETCALEWGQHYFDYEVQSRETDDLGRPIAIATTEHALSGEFFERRSVSRLPVPLSFGDSNGNLIPEAQLTLGEVAPQIYTSTVSTRKVAWFVNFKSHRHVAAAVSAKDAIRRNPSAPSIAQGSTAMQNLPTSFNYLQIYVPVTDYGLFRRLHNGFQANDIIGLEPTLKDTFQAWWTTVFGSPRR